jgi:hypothetical protein
MNRQPFEHLLRSFVSDVPDAAPRDLLESVLIQLPSTNQRRRRFGVVGRFPDMLTPLRTIAAVAAVLVIAVVGYSILAKSPSSGGPLTTPSPTLAPSPTIATSALPGPTARITGATLVSDSTNLVAGVTYVMRLFEPAFTFTGVDGIRFDTDAQRYAWLEHTTSTNPLLAVVAVGSVFDERGAVVALPSDLVAWVQARTDFDIAKTSAIQLGSVSGTLIEGTVQATAHANASGHINLFCPQASCAFEGGGSSGFDPGQRFEIVVVTVNGEQIVASGGATPAEWPTIGVDFDAFLRSIRFPA